ncbi:MAG: heme NO-binding domain-containing protein [Planctomycetes bacterium]|nr:heme NO-binding domain-containing protein [Planctomycetota bacterium]
MYGLVNRAIEDLVCSRFGADAWQAICRRAGIERPSFVGMQPYDDAITYSLVAAAAAELQTEDAAVLETFGEHWMTYTVEEGYGDLLSMMGETLEQFLDNLDAMHGRIQAQMPALRPPHLRREPLPDGDSILHYHSDRPGLAPMVVGLLRGLARRFDVEVETSRLPPVGTGHERFLLRVRRR